MQMKQTLTAALVAAFIPMAMTATPALAFKSHAKTPAAGTMIKAGTKVNGKINTTLDSGKNVDGDTFQMTMAPGMFQNKLLKGSVLEGHVEGVKSAAKFGKKGAMSIEFDDIRTPDGMVHPVSAMLASAPKAEGKKLRTAALMLGGAVVGHHLGKSNGTKHAALMGAVAGGAIALAMPGGNVVIKSGTNLDVKFTQDLSF